MELAGKSVACILSRLTSLQSCWRTFVFLYWRFYGFRQAGDAILLV